MKKFLMTCAALSGLALSSAGYAADLAVRPAPVVAPAAPWTGCYIGIHAGAGWGDKWWADRNLTDNVSYPTSGWVGGAQLGCNYQTGPLVVGAAIVLVPDAGVVLSSVRRLISLGDTTRMAHLTPSDDAR